MPLPALALAGPALQAGFGIYNAAQGASTAKRAERDRLAAREAMEDTRYADYNQAYYDELQRRASVGLPQEQLNAMQQGADRAAGVALATSEDRRGGLMGIGRAQTSLSDAYRNIGLADVAQREQNAQAVLAEMSDRGLNSYTEQQGLNAYDLNLAEQRRQEGLSQRQAGFQGILGGVSQAGAMGAQMLGGGIDWGAAGGGQSAVNQQNAMVTQRATASPTQGVNMTGQQQVTGLPQNQYYNPTYGGGGFGGGQGISYAPD